MARVAIIGSCITRDLWPIRGETVRDILYVSRTSLASLFAPAVRGVEAEPVMAGGLQGHQRRAVAADLRKTALRELVAFRPTHLIVDFIDERFDLLAAGNAVATHSWELEVSGLLDRPELAGARPIPRLSAACERLWRQGAAELAALAAATPLRDARVILHSARWATHHRSRSGRRKPFEQVEAWAGRPMDIGAHNALLARYDAAFLAQFPQAAVVRAPKHQVADEDHRWQLSAFHYVPDYYLSIAAQLAELGVDCDVSAALAGPSAPAG